MQVTQKRSTCSRSKAPAPAPGPEETFDLNVSDSDDDDDGGAAGPAPTNSGASPMDVGINNADIHEGRKLAADIRYFFDVTPANKICKKCR